MHDADLILTDSGGVQEEAPYFGIPVLVMRETSERMEGVEAGCLRLVGTQTESIVREATAVLDAPAKWKAAKAQRTRPATAGLRGGSPTPSPATWKARMPAVRAPIAHVAPASVGGPYRTQAG